MSNYQPELNNRFPFILQQLLQFYLKLTNLSVQREGVELHGADEGDVGGLAVVHPLPGIYPQSSKFGKDVDWLKSFQIVDEDIGNPEAFH